MYIYMYGCNIYDVMYLYLHIVLSMRVHTLTCLFCYMLLSAVPAIYVYMSVNVYAFMSLCLCLYFIYRQVLFVRQRRTAGRTQGRAAVPPRSSAGGCGRHEPSRTPAGTTTTR